MGEECAKFPQPVLTAGMMIYTSAYVWVFELCGAFCYLTGQVLTEKEGKRGAGRHCSKSFL